jgi:hypothetical protein
MIAESLSRGHRRRKIGAMVASVHGADHEPEKFSDSAFNLPKFENYFEYV